MLWGAIGGIVAGILIGVMRALFSKGPPCPHCGETLPLPWFKPLTECPACGGDVTPDAEAPPPRRGGAASGRLSWVPALLFGVLALGGLVGAGLVLPSALESRRVWQHQSGKVEEARRELGELRGRQDPQSRRRAAELEGLSRSLNPESYEEEYRTKTLIAGAGLGCFLAFGLAAFFFRPRQVPGGRAVVSGKRNAPTPSRPRKR